MYARSKSLFHIWALFLLLTSVLGSAATTTPAYAGATIVVNTNAEADVLISDGKCSLREAITNANYDNAVYANCPAGSGTDTITFDADYTITLSFGELNITSPIIINGNGAANAIIQANANPNTATWRVFEVSNTGNLTLDGVTVRNGRCDGSCPTATNQGGGIYVNGGGLTVTNSTLSGNRTSGTGGGGGIYNNGGTVAVTNSTLSQNSSLFGGGIQSGGGSLSVTNSTFSGNFAYKGGGIGGGNFSVTNSTLSGNGADTGGGIYHTIGTLTVTNSILIDNDATNDGGGISNSGGTLILTNSALSGNSAGEYGGGIFNQPHTTLVVTNSTLSGNSAHYGGGIYGNGSDLSVTNSTLYTNSATYYGGGIYGAIYYDDSGSSMPVANSTFYANSASKGGGIYVLGVNLTVTNSTLAGNRATTGGGIYNFGTGTLNYANTIIANSASGGDCSYDGAIGMIGTNINNLVGDGSCSAVFSGDPKLGILGDNGGNTPTMALLPNSPAINAGDDATCASSPVNNLDQRGVTRPIGAHCDIGSFEAEVFISLSLGTDSIDFGVQSVGAASAPQIVTVTNDGTADLILGALSINGDFALTNDNCSGQTVAAAGSCNFAVSFQPTSIGAKNGTVWIPSNAASSPDTVTLSGTGVLATTTSFKSIGTYDGYILESGENSNVGGSVSAGGATLIIGDNAYKKQYRVILHFNTANLPDNAVITKLMLKVKKQGGTGTNPFTVLGSLQVDIAAPYFGSGVSLLASDFQAAANVSNAGSFNPSPLTGNWFSASLNSSTFPYLNLTGTTQFRLAFSLDDNNDAIANTLKFFSGNYSGASYRPELIVTYYLP